MTEPNDLLCAEVTPRRRLCHSRSGSVYGPAKGSSEQPSITRFIPPICSGRGSSSFPVRTSCVRPTVHVSRPTCDPVLPPLPPPAFRIRSRGRSPAASMMPLSCRWSSATATFRRNRSFSSQISPSQGRQRISSSPQR